MDFDVQAKMSEKKYTVNIIIYDMASWSDITVTPCNKIDKLLVIYICSNII